MSGTQVGEVIERATAALFDGAQEEGAAAVRVDAATAELLGDRFTLRGAGAWRDLVGEEVGSNGRTFLGKPATCVGRAGELASLETALAECIAEPRSRAVLIVAPPGTGKSRLVEAHRARVSTDLVADVLMAHGDPVRSATSFGVAAQLIEGSAGIGEGDAPSARADKVRAMVERVAPSKSRHLGAFLGEIAGAYASSADTPQELRAARADATRAREHRRHPMGRSRFGAALGCGTRRSRRASALGRRDRTPDVATSMPNLFRKRSLIEIHLGPLAQRAARAFVEGALGKSAPAATVDVIVERAGGHPFFLEELVRACLARRSPPRASQRCSARRPRGRSQRDSAGSWIERSSRGAPAPGDFEHGFRHAMFADAAYAMLTDRDRLVAHRLAAEWLEKHPDTEPSLVAEHYDHGGAPVAALPYFRRAAKRALARSDLEGAAKFAERGLGCGPDDEGRGALLAVQSEVAYWRGDLEVAWERASSASIAATPSACFASRG